MVDIIKHSDAIGIAKKLRLPSVTSGDDESRAKSVSFVRGKAAVVIHGTVSFFQNNLAIGIS